VHLRIPLACLPPPPAQLVDLDTPGTPAGLHPVERSARRPAPHARLGRTKHHPPAHRRSADRSRRPAAAARKRRPLVTRLRSNVIPNLKGSVMYQHCVEVYLRHQPGPGGSCTCGYVGCRARYNASIVIHAAGVDPTSLTAADAKPRPWHERSVRPRQDEANAAPPSQGAQVPPAASGITAAPGAGPAAPERGWGADPTAPHPPTISNGGLHR
jgi:hypothetical protein